ncbi:MAG: hypothetical protein M1595_02525 [Candidatus Thermoplasmatota archaeon]|jgi:hypothetical protein|nr:hypothetical protein [Candidatus Thermoplasmatota archaeon]
MSGLNDISVKLIDDEEYKEFREYYVNSRKLDRKAVEIGISILSRDINEKTRLLEIANKEVDKTIISNFGEACVSYHLEKKSDIILTHAGWKHNPFDISLGVDLVGGNISDPSNISIIYVEVKTRKNSSYKYYTLKSLKDQLTLNRIEQKFKLSTGEYSYIGITSRLRKHIRENKISSQPKINFRSDYFERFGALVAGKIDPWQKIIIQAHPGDNSSNRPCRLLLLILEKLETRFNELFSIETLVDEHPGAP